jgi:hypothetical protein
MSLAWAGTARVVRTDAAKIKPTIRIRLVPELPDKKGIFPENRAEAGHQFALFYQNISALVAGTE